MSELKTAACPGVWRDFLGCLNKSQGTLQAVFRSEPGETASSPAVPQLCSTAVNYSQLQTTTCGALAIFLCLQNVLIPWNFRFLKLAGLLVCCQKSMLLGSKKNLKKKRKKEAKFCVWTFAFILEKAWCCQTQGREGLFPTRFRILLCISRVLLQHM